MTSLLASVFLRRHILMPIVTHKKYGVLTQGRHPELWRKSDLGGLELGSSDLSRTGHKRSQEVPCSGPVVPLQLKMGRLCESCPVLVKKHLKQA